MKADFLDGRVNASAAYFEIHESNRALSDDEYNNQTPIPSNYAYKSSKAVTKGYEVEMSGEIAPAGNYRRAIPTRSCAMTRT